MRPEIMKICRHRLGCDGRGVTTLVAFHGCPLNCKYCINDECHCDDTERMYLSPQKLLDIVRIDDIYFRMTEGGITFGGGEPLLHVDYLLKFARLMLPGWKLRIETSLYTEWEEIERLIPFVDQWIIDVKETNSEIFERYTGKPQGKLMRNYIRLSKKVPKDKLLFRIPHIPGFNTDEDIEVSEGILSNFGEIEVFDYIVRNNKDVEDKEEIIRRTLNLNYSWNRFPTEIPAMNF